MTMPPSAGHFDGHDHGPAVNDIPVCPRHPQVAAYTRCQRCARPACPACQVPASVGFHCVDCVAAERKANPARAQRSELGMTAAPGRPYVTIGIIVICALVWLAESASAAFFSDVAFVGVLAKSEPWRYLTNGFAHETGTPMHILLNMLALYFMGQYLEPMLGRVRFAGLYLLSIIGGTVCFQLMTAPSSPADVLNSGWVTPLVGASGGVFGLFLAVVVFNRHLGRDIGPMMSTIALNLVFGFFVQGVAWQAHVGGAIAGGVGAGALYALRRKSAAVQLGALGGMAVLLMVAAYVDFAMVDLPPVMVR